MAAVASLFSVFSRALSSSQATVELTAKMRSAAWQLRQDLAGVTVRMRPPVHPESNSGYFELIEGPLRDTKSVSPPTTTDLSADTDDILLFTTKSAGAPFVGRYGDTDLVESDTAEVAWFCREAPASQQPSPPTPFKVFNLHRRELLVLGYVGKPPFLKPERAGNWLDQSDAPPPTDALAQQQNYDVSMRQYWFVDAQTPTRPRFDLIPNTLSDLTARENRFGHLPREVDAAMPTRSRNFPYAVHPIAKLVLDETNQFGRAGQDVILTNVIAFDVRVYAPSARAQPTASTSMLPGDPGYLSAAAGSFGAFVDLGSGVGGPLGGAMVGRPNQRMLPAVTYDTWSLGYEFNGIDEDESGVADDASDKRDKVPPNGLVDDHEEFETSPPYPVPLRGLEVRIRCYEPASTQVRQITIRQVFN